MKSIIQHQEQKELKFPKLMISESGLVVLFFSPKCGTVVHQGSGGTAFGSHSKDFNMNHFKDFFGKIILVNEI